VPQTALATFHGLISLCLHSQAVSDVGQLCEDVGRLFLLDMLLGEFSSAAMVSCQLTPLLEAA